LLLGYTILLFFRAVRRLGDSFVKKVIIQFGKRKMGKFHKA